MRGGNPLNREVRKENILIFAFLAPSGVEKLGR